MLRLSNRALDITGDLNSQLSNGRQSKTMQMQLSYSPSKDKKEKAKIWPVLDACSFFVLVESVSVVVLALFIFYFWLKQSDGTLAIPRPFRLSSKPLQVTIQKKQKQWNKSATSCIRGRQKGRLKKIGRVITKSSVLSKLFNWTITKAASNRKHKIQ